MDLIWGYEEPKWVPTEPWTEDDGDLWRAMQHTRPNVPESLFMRTRISRRFWEFVVPGPDGCQEWIGPKATSGYGLMFDHFAHRVSYSLFVGKIRWGSYILHKCDNRVCVNPEHLYAGKQVENQRDTMARGRHHRQVWVVVPANENAMQINRSAPLDRIRKMRPVKKRKPKPKP